MKEVINPLCRDRREQLIKLREELGYFWIRRLNYVKMSFISK